MKFNFFVAFLFFVSSLSSFVIHSVKVKEPIIRFSEVVRFDCNSKSTKPLFDDRIKVVKIKNKFYLNGTIEFMNRLNQRQFTYVTVTTIPKTTRTIDYYNFCLFMSHEEFILFPLLKELKHCPLKQSVSVEFHKFVIEISNSHSHSQDEWRFNMTQIRFSRQKFLQIFQPNLGIWGLRIIFHQDSNKKNDTIVREERENCLEFRGSFTVTSPPSKQILLN